jgi:hypothetical protein
LVCCLDFLVAPAQVWNVRRTQKLRKYIMKTKTFTLWAKVGYVVALLAFIIGVGLTVAGFGRVGFPMALIAMFVALAAAQSSGHLTNFGKKDRE